MASQSEQYRSFSHNATKNLPFHQMTQAIQKSEKLGDLNLKQKINQIDVYNMNGTGGPSFGQISPADLVNSKKLYNGIIEVQSKLKNTMNSPQRKYFQDKHEPYAPNLSTTIPHIVHSHTPKLGFNGMQLRNGQGGGMLSPQAGPSRQKAMSITAHHFGSTMPSSSAAKGQSGMNNSFFSPKQNHLKDTFFQLPHMNQQGSRIRHLSIQRLGEETFQQGNLTQMSHRSNGSNGISPKIDKQQILRAMNDSRTFGGDDPLHSVTGKVGRNATFLDTMHNKFNLSSTVGKKTKMDMWDMATILDSQQKHQEDHAQKLYKKAQQEDHRNFLKTQIDFKKQMIVKENELKNRDLRNVEYKTAKLQRYDEQRRQKHTKFIGDLAEENKLHTLTHIKHNNISKYETDCAMKASFQNGHKMLNQSHKQQCAIQQDQKDILIAQQQNEITERMIEKMKRHQEEFDYEKVGLQQRERDFQNRDRRVAAHHQKISERDNALYNTFSKPNQDTHTKWDLKKTDHVNKLNQEIGQKYQQKLRKNANVGKAERQALMDQTITTNKQFQIERENYHNQK